MSDLYEIFQQSARGDFPAPDGVVELLPKPIGAKACVVAFTHHNFVAADVSDGWLDAALDPDDPSSEMSPGFLVALASLTGTTPDTLDVLLAGLPNPGTPAIELEPLALDDPHRRLQRALAHRTDVRAYATADKAAVLVLGRGLAGRMEAGIEVEPGARGKGLGVKLARAALQLTEPDEALFVQVSPGNVASLRMVLAAGFKPVAGEILFN